MHPRILRVAERFSRISPWDSAEILREELFSIERLEQHAESLAAAQQLTPRPVLRRSLAVRLRENESVLLAAYHAMAAAVGEGRAITPAAEWLLDNYHLVEEQIREICRDLPPGYYRQLPKLAGGPFAGYPRVFAIAWAFVAHNDSRFDPETLRRFVRAYQRVQPLTIGELWAVAITLRIVLVENLRRAAQSIVTSRRLRQDADAIADRLLGVNGQAADPQALFKSHGRDATLSSAFAVQLVQRLRDQDPRLTPALPWLAERLAAQGTNFDEIVSTEHGRQGVSNVTVRNIITSMRLMSEVDWTELFESISPVDEILRGDNAFAAMDFATRNLYRSAVEELARSSRQTELQVAHLARAAAEACTEPRKRDPGYHLLAAGRPAFEKRVGCRPSIQLWLARLARTAGALQYIATIVLTGAIVLAIPLLILHSHGISGSVLALLALLGLIPAIDAAVALVNRVVTRRVGANILPGLALRDGIPADLRTMIAVPVLLTTREAIAEQIERLEVHYLSSAEGDLHFALLSDWADADTEHVDGDRELLETAYAGIAQLNLIHGHSLAGPRFLLLHRRRRWSDTQQRWMGWERKRGKLHELNELLRGSTDTTFMTANGEAPWIPAGVRYVLTLDADTRLPREAARRLVGKMAHPLNQPRFDVTSRRVVEGYAVLQPRVTPSLPADREGSSFQRVFSSAGGIDPYAAATSDVYQDLLGEGSYAGKGIYDVDAFEASLRGRVPEGTLLSHDLFEGIFARAGLASDVEVVEDFPSRYDVAALRQHRWARGDWQLLPWMLGRRDALVGARGAIPLIGRWKMLDNLRRTLSAPASIAALTAGWTLATPDALLWTVFILGALASPALLPLLAAIGPWRDGVTARSHMRALRIDAWSALSQIALLTAFLAHHAWLMVDAIGRTLFRLYGSRRDLLEWVTADQARIDSHLSVSRFYGDMRGAVGVAVMVAIALIIWGSPAWPIALPGLILWMASPAIALRVSRAAQVAERSSLSIADAHKMRLVARRTWRFFEAFVSKADNHLPPDNFQEDPHAVLAHRTSPTNIGLYLLSAVTAHDFGWSGIVETVERLEATLATLARLQRYRGHLFNWYDTRDLRPLDPRYVSSVDSGNLAAHLIATANACREWQQSASLGAQKTIGIADAVDLAREALQELPETLHIQEIARHELEDALDRLDSTLRAPLAAPNTVAERMNAIVPLAATLADIAHTLTGESHEDACADLAYWADAAHRTSESTRRDLLLTSDETSSLKGRLATLSATALEMALAMDFGFLFDPQRRLLSIGFRATDGSLDPSCYDLLASEARLASFIAIAKGDVPARHWFRLGRPVTPIGYGAALISWSGSMFEYLMPPLVMREPAGSLLAQTGRLTVRRQMSYGATLGIPWGISESAYNARDLELTYQY